MQIESAVPREITELHEFFAGWLGGTLSESDAAFRRLERALGDGFVLVSPSGAEIGRTRLLTNLRGAHGSRPGIRIWVEGASLLVDEPPLLVARYEEYQESDQKVTRRISTAVFRRSADAPNGVQWLRVHETWLTGGAS